MALSVLALRPGEDVSVERLADALWPATPPPTWPKVVQGCVMRLRRSLGHDAVLTTPGGYRLDRDAVELDVLEFERLVLAGRGELDAGRPRHAEALLTDAVGLWRGAPFTELEDWVPARTDALRLTEELQTAEEDLLAARLQVPDNGQVVAQARQLVGEAPLRERRWALLARAQYRSGQQADALGTLRRARRRLAEDFGLDPGEELTDLETAILRHDPALRPRPLPASSECPYQGLPSYDVVDSTLFFGRDAEVAACLEKLDTVRLLVLAGPSGCGKSSLLRAGIAVALAERGTTAVMMTPGADPEAAFADALARGAAHGVLLVDQFEESFTLSDQGAARHWLDRLADLAHDVAPVVVAVRADHVGSLTLSRRFATMAEAGIHLVTPLAGDDLRAAIEGPALHAGLTVGPGLVDLVVRDTEGEPGALPLMSHALAQAWEHRTEDTLTVADYEVVGGIRGAVAQTADRLYDALDGHERPLLKGVLLRLVVADEAGAATPVRYPKAALQTDPDRARLVELLVRARLVTADSSGLRIAHEALARAWPRLRDWLREDAEGQRIRAHLASAAIDWDGVGRDSDELYQGVRLGAALDWAGSHPGDVTLLEQEFLDASAERASSDRRILERRSREQARQNRRLRSLLIGAFALVLLAASFGALALASSRRADEERGRAEAAEVRTRHEALVNRSLSLRPTNRGAAALLAHEAFAREPDAQSRSALLATYTSPDSEGFLGYTHLGETRWVQGTLVPGTDRAVLATNGRYLGLVDRHMAEVTDRFPSTPRWIGGHSLLRTSRDGRLLVQVSDTYGPAADDARCGSVAAYRHDNGRACSQVSVYDLDARAAVVLAPFHAPFLVTDAAVDPSLGVLALTGSATGDLVVYSLATGRPVGRVAGHQRVNPRSLDLNRSRVAFDVRGRLFLGSTSGEVRAFDVRAGLRQVGRYVVPRLSTDTRMIVTSDGVLVAAGTQAVTGVDVRSGRRLWSEDLRDTRSVGSCGSLAVSEVGRTVYCSDPFGLIAERSLATGGLTGRVLDPQLGRAGDLEVRSDGRELVAFNDSLGIVTRWRLDGSGLLSTVVARGHRLAGGYDPSGRHLLVVDPDRPADVAVWDVSRDRQVARFSAPGGASWAGPGVVAALGRPGGAVLVDVRGGRVRASPGALPARTEAVFPQEHGIFAAVPRPRQPATWRLVGLDPGARRSTVELESVPAWSIQSISTNADGSRVLVTADGLEVVESSIYDGRTGNRLASGLPFQTITAIAPDGTIVGSDTAGAISVFDLDSMEKRAEFPGTKGEVTSLQFSDAGMVLVGAANRSVQLLDLPSRLRLADPLRTAAPTGLPEGQLRPDGQAFALSTRDGVTVWDVRDSRLLAGTCAVAGRNLSAVEWTTYLGEPVDDEEGCPGLWVPGTFG